MATANNKDTIYIDIDDEITTIIDKVRTSNDKIVALVLPKRATVLQSIVNMKLLKRTADNEQKNLVLITAEAGLLPLAGIVGLYVAKTLQSKPEIPATTPAGPIADDLAESANLDEVEEITSATAGDRPVGELAGAATPAAVAAAASADPAGVDAMETLELDDEPLAAAAGAAADKTATDTKLTPPTKAKKPKKNKKLAVPNFERFRLLLIIGIIALIALIVGIVFAVKVLPKASITVLTDSVDINSSLSFTADKSVKTFDSDQRILPAQVQQVQKPQTQQVATTGKKNNGAKASGTVTLALKDCSNSTVTVPAGSGLSSNGHTYITQSEATLNSVKVGNRCNPSQFQDIYSTSVKVVALAGGADYNLDNGATFSVNSSIAGASSVSASASSAIDGGTDDIIQIVAQSDIDNATQKLAAQDPASTRSQLSQQLKTAGYYPIDATFVAATPTTSNSSNVGDQASTVTVTQTTSYSMYGVKQADLKTLVDNDVKKQIDPAKQSILSEGLDKASFKVNNSTANNVQISLATTATAGPDLSADDIKRQMAGKKEGQVKDTLKALPGVTDVQVKLSPFWVTSVPGDASKVTVTFQKAN